MLLYCPWQCSNLDCWIGGKHTNHEASMPPQSYIILNINISISFSVGKWYKCIENNSLLCSTVCCLWRIQEGMKFPQFSVSTLSWLNRSLIRNGEKKKRCKNFSYVWFPPNFWGSISHCFCQSPAKLQIGCLIDILRKISLHLSKWYVLQRKCFL